MLCFKFLSLTFVFSTSASLAADIVVFATVASVSHRNILKPLVEHLYAHGHSVTIFTDSAVGNISSGIHKLLITDGKDLERKAKFFYFRAGKELSMYTMLDVYSSITIMRCKKVVEGKEFQDMVSGTRTPDLIIGMHPQGECGLAVAHKLQVPFISISTTRLMGQFANNILFLYPATHAQITPYSSSMSFRERLTSFTSFAALTFHRDFRIVPKMDIEFKDIFGENIPSILEMEKNVSLMFVNTQGSVSQPQPYPPHVIEVGGMHLRPGESLPEDLEEWMRGSGKNGVIYFSLGAATLARNMQESRRKIFLHAFSQLPQRVLWKWETGRMEDLPDNVRVYKFFPQQDLLAHPSTKLFITHGGMMSIQETVYHGVPIIGIPGGWDQPSNIESLVSRNAGIMLTWETLTNKTLLDAINAVIYEPSFKENIQEVSSVFKDQPMSPLDTAMYWVEFVIRHKGAGHLKSAALDLTWYQYYALDIILFLIGTATFSLWILCCTLRQVFRNIRKKALRRTSLKKKKD